MVLDPDNGSGTTGVAAKLLGHDNIGFALSDHSLGKTKDRMNNISAHIFKKFRESSVVNAPKIIPNLGGLPI